VPVHDSGLKDINGRAYDTGDEACAKPARNMHGKAFLHAVYQTNLLELIVRCELGRVDDRVADHVGGTADPKAFDTILRHRLLIRVNGRAVGAFCWRQLSLALHSNFDKISWVGHCDSHGTSHHASCNFWRSVGF